MRATLALNGLNLKRKIKESEILEKKLMSIAIKENKLTITIKNFNENSIYIGNLCV